MDDEFDALLNGRSEPRPGAAAPAAPPPASAPASAPKPPRPRHPALPWVVVGIVALLAAGGALAFALLARGGDAPGPGASPSASPSASPGASPSPSAPASGSLPGTCRDIFSPDYHAQLAATGAVLSEGNTGAREQPFEQPEVPEVVESTVAAAPHLECVWSFAGNQSVGISTVLAEVSDAQAAEVEQALAAAGFTASRELGSTRYIKEVPGAEGFGPHGYSIIARDGVLVATEWLDWPAAGYTADIVNTVLGPVG